MNKTKTSTLKRNAIEAFNAYIRQRDRDNACISCGRYVMLQAGHFYSAGKHTHMRFNEDNVHGQCVQCNYYLSANLLKYRDNLIKKIGQERVERLDFLASQRVMTKDNRFYFIEIIEKYSPKDK